MTMLMIVLDRRWRWGCWVLKKGMVDYGTSIRDACDWDNDVDGSVDDDNDVVEDNDFGNNNDNG